MAGSAFVLVVDAEALPSGIDVTRHECLVVAGTLPAYAVHAILGLEGLTLFRDDGGLLSEVIAALGLGSDASDD